MQVSVTANCSDYEVFRQFSLRRRNCIITIFPPVLQHTKVFQLVETTCVSPVQISLTFFYFCSAIPWVKVQVNILPASLTVLFALMAFKLTGGRSWLSLGSNVLSERSLVLSFGHRRGQIHLHINQ